MSDKYWLKYKLDLETADDGYTSDDATSEYGLTDALILFSILHQEDGSYSQRIAVSVDGKEHRALSPSEIYKFWLVLGLGLEDSGELTGGQRQFMKHFKTIFDLTYKFHKE